MSQEIDGLAEDCSISSAKALGILQACTKSSKRSWSYSLQAPRHLDPDVTKRGEKVQVSFVSFAT